MSHIQLRNISFRYHGSQQNTLQDINMSISQNQCVLILGNEDAGKSTLGMIIKGLIPHFNLGTFKGEVLIDNHPQYVVNTKESITKIGYLFTHPQNQLSMVKETVMDEIAFACENLNYDRNETIFRVKAMARLCEITPILNKSVHSCSLGTLQKVALASMLVLDPDIIIFDEPLTHLDHHAQDHFIKIIHDLKKQGKTIIILDHEFVQYQTLVDHVFYLDQGQVTSSGTLNEVNKSNSLIISNMMSRLVNDVITPKKPIITLEDAIMALQGVHHD
jgi:energy-coupling factor transport system ATP-binding protein